MMKNLIESEVNINIFNSGYTSFHLAIMGDDIQIVKLIINEGANVNSADKSNPTTLHLLEKSGAVNDIKVAELLKESELLSK